MIEFWLSAGLLLLAALGFLLIPVLRGRKAQAEEDRTALNVTLYQERLQELENQRQAGTLSEEQWQNGRDEAARELLADTEGAESKARVGVLGSKVPLTAALLMPLLGYGLYLFLGGGGGGGRGGGREEGGAGRRLCGGGGGARVCPGAGARWRRSGVRGPSPSSRRPSRR